MNLIVNGKFPSNMINFSLFFVVKKSSEFIIYSSLYHLNKIVRILQ